ncbi:type II secretion system protein N [uncultured Desulfobacter sp.]|uniref:type II secretion system protein N n=1 Tax=uncultured Desulfobacter sp. TaxID=240139 RepID=UPI002AABC3EA|nr:type II secretion system protein N [uncultured Desulfobacter sp.]
MKPIFSTVITALIMLVTFQVYALVNPVVDKPGEQLLSNRPQADPTHPKAKSDRLEIEPVKLKRVIEKVTQRNLFKVEVNGKKNNLPEPETLPLEKTSLKLTLWGTVTGQDKQDAWAVIEDIKKKQQDLYRVNDNIQGATIKSILRNKVILTMNGKDQILEVDADPVPFHARKKGVSIQRPKPGQNNAPDRLEPPEMPEVQEPAAHSDPLFRTRPYVKNGQAAGVMIYSIKKDSVARRLGLRNGDIIQAVDDTEVQNPQDLEELESTMEDPTDITLSILRRGKAKELVFSGQDNAFTINDVEQ